MVEINTRRISPHSEPIEIDAGQIEASRKYVNWRWKEDLHTIFSDSPDPHASFTTGLHTLMTTNLMLIVASDFEEVDLLTHGALVHDTGKYVKKLRKVHQYQTVYTQPERELMWEHPIHSLQRLDSNTHTIIKNIAQCHHLRYKKGWGYPQELASIDIPPEAVIMSIIDEFESNTSDRGYNGRITFREGINYLRRDKFSNGVFNPDFLWVVDRLEEHLNPIKLDYLHAFSRSYVENCMNQEDKVDAITFATELTSDLLRH